MATRVRKTKDWEFPYEILIDGKWVGCDREVLMAFPGRRRIKGEEHTGPVYYLGTEEEVPEEVLARHTDCVHPLVKRRTPEEQKEHEHRLRLARLALINRISLEHEIPLDLAHAMVTIAIPLVISEKELVSNPLELVLSDDKMAKLELIGETYDDCWKNVAKAFGISIVKIDNAMKMAWEGVHLLVERHKRKTFDVVEAPTGRVPRKGVRKDVH